MAVLETSFLIDVMRGYPPAVALLHELENKETFFVTTITILELWEGTLNSNNQKREKDKVENLLSSLNILDFDMISAKKTAEVNIKLAGNMIDPEDVMTGSIALTKNEMVITRDNHFSRIPGLKVLVYS